MPAAPLNVRCGGGERKSRRPAGLRILTRCGHFRLAFDLRHRAACEDSSVQDIRQMPAPTPNARGAEFWNSTMGRSWVSQQAVISDVFTSVTSVSLDAAAAKPGEYVADIGCGTGDTLLTFAKLVGPSGAVLGVDISVP